MINQTLTFITDLLNDHLKLSFKLNEDMAFVSPLKEYGNQLPKNRVSISLVNIERETGGGIQFKQQPTTHKYSRSSAPGWLLNIYVLISVIFSEKQYMDSLQLTSGILSFIQKNQILTLNDTGATLTMEPVNLSFQEQSNLWSINGGNYFPSLLCKIRILTVDGQEVTGLSTVISDPDIHSTYQS